MLAALSARDVLFVVFGKLDFSSLIGAAQVCRVWQGVANDERLWQQICQQHSYDKLPHNTWRRSFRRIEQSQCYCRLKIARQGMVKGEYSLPYKTVHCFLRVLEEHLRPDGPHPYVLLYGERSYEMWYLHELLLDASRQAQNHNCTLEDYILQRGGKISVDNADGSRTTAQLYDTLSEI